MDGLGHPRPSSLSATPPVPAVAPGHSMDLFSPPDSPCAPPPSPCPPPPPTPIPPAHPALTSRRRKRLPHSPETRASFPSYLPDFSEFETLLTRPKRHLSTALAQQLAAMNLDPSTPNQTAGRIISAPSGSGTPPSSRSTSPPSRSKGILQARRRLPSPSCRSRAKSSQADDLEMGTEDIRRLDEDIRATVREALAVSEKTDRNPKQDQMVKENTGPGKDRSPRLPDLMAAVGSFPSEEWFRKCTELEREKRMAIVPYANPRASLLTSSIVREQIVEKVVSKTRESIEPQRARDDIHIARHSTSKLSDIDMME